MSGCAGWDEPGEEALAGRAFASGLVSIQRNKVSGVGAKYRVSHAPTTSQNNGTAQLQVRAEKTLKLEWRKCAM